MITLSKQIRVKKAKPRVSHCTKVFMVSQTIYNVPVCHLHLNTLQHFPQTLGWKKGESRIKVYPFSGWRGGGAPALNSPVKLLYGGTRK